MMAIKSKTIEETLEDMLEYYGEDGMSFEDILEMFNLTPLEVFILAYNNGLIDLDDLPENL